MLIKSLFLHVFCFFRFLIMSRRFALTDYEKGRIDELKRVNNNNRQITAELGRSHIIHVLAAISTLHQHMALLRDQNVHPYSINSTSDISIVRLASSSTISSAETADQLDNKVSARRSCQVLSYSKVMEYVHVTTARLSKLICISHCRR